MYRQIRAKFQVYIGWFTGENGLSRLFSSPKSFWMESWRKLISSNCLMILLSKVFISLFYKHKDLYLLLIRLKRKFYGKIVLILQKMLYVTLCNSWLYGHSKYLRGKCAGN